MHQPTHRSLRGFLIAAVATAAVVISGGSALAAHQTGHSGSPGAWDLPDSAANPAARCSYNGGGVLGGTYLTGIGLIRTPELFGTSSALQSVGYRPLVQHLESGVWVTVKKGKLITGQATKSHAAVLPVQRVGFGPRLQPKNPFRLAIKAIWYAPDATVQGTRVIAVDSYVRRNGGVASRCAGFVSDVTAS